MRFTHQLRSLHDGILVGIGTVKNDNPGLTVRLVEGPNPVTIIVTSSLDIPLTSKVLEHHGFRDAPIVLCRPVQNDPLLHGRRKQLEELGVRIVECPLRHDSPELNLAAAFGWWY